MPGTTSLVGPSVPSSTHPLLCLSIIDRYITVLSLLGFLTSYAIDLHNFVMTIDLTFGDERDAAAAAGLVRAATAAATATEKAGKKE